MSEQKSILILCGGGPAPGINTVISAVSKQFIAAGYRVIGLHEGYKNLFNGKSETVDINFEFADKIFNIGGSTLQMSRYKPKNEEFNPDFFVKNNIKLLVTIGGDDTASTATRISNYLAEHNVKIQNIHVPKTIDNDLPLPEGISTFGYQSAKDEGARITAAVYEDSRTSGVWFVLCAMGREAGHLAFGIGAASHSPMIIIPEMFSEENPVTLDKIVKLIISSIVKRKIMGIPYGVAIVSEGVFHDLPDEELKSSGVTFTYDEHGHPELGTVSKAHIFNILVQNKLKELNLNVKTRPVELGYELRCIAPKAFDLFYCNLLGIGVKILYDQGYTGCMVTGNQRGDIKGVFLKDMVDPKTGKIATRLVNMKGNKCQMIYRFGLQYITESDYDAARKYLKNPEDYDFNKLVNIPN
ncbi:MAG: 6-phosphofructokinase [Prevotellaceae bacterium]|jgi:6-phosphofructokinase 1|nr:6-phosphofructokinase [Prevotellaceae bacterium]